MAPAIQTGRIGFFASVQENAVLVLITSVVFLLLLILLVTLFLMGYFNRRDKLVDSKRLKKRDKEFFKLQTFYFRISSRNDLLQGISPNQTTTALETGRSTITSRDVGISNFAFEDENIHNRGSHINHDVTKTSVVRFGSATSSENTSDSSVYSPLNPPNADLQSILDAKAATLFDKRSKRHQYDRPEAQEAVYATVISEKKREKLRKIGKKHKHKRRYISENRVGSVEEMPRKHSHHQNQSSTEEITDSNESLVETINPNYENFDRGEAYNPHNNYHRNKLLQNRIFTDRGYPGVHDVHRTTEAINRQIIKALQPSEKSSETGSIGSFLSMASVKSFPKSSHPEPLNRVLDPVFVTYYDNLDDSTQPPPVPVKPPQPPQKAARKYPPRSNTEKLQRLPQPKAPIKSVRIASQSDNPDPGVVGPIVWEAHKKEQKDNTVNGNKELEN